MKYITKLGFYKYGITHAGLFHADEVFATAFLRLIDPEFKVLRMHEIPKDIKEDVLVFDIGLKEFDHHQLDKEARFNEVPFAAFGLIVREFYEDLNISSKVYNKLDSSFIQKMDDYDNGNKIDTLPKVISEFNPSWNSTVSRDEQFEKAVDFAKIILLNKINSIVNNFLAESTVKKALKNMEDGIVILERFAPFTSILPSSKAKIVIYPSERGGYCAQAIPFHKKSEGLKVLFPENWAGRSKEELNKYIKGLNFCHAQRFLIAGDNLDVVKKACNYTLNNIANKKGDF